MFIERFGSCGHWHMVGRMEPIAVRLGGRPIDPEPVVEWARGLPSDCSTQVQQEWAEDEPPAATYLTAEELEASPHPINQAYGGALVQLRDQIEPELPLSRLRVIFWVGAR
jgi:hypothetical protein